MGHPVRRYHSSEAHFIAAAARESGELVQLPDGRIGSVSSLNGAAIGDRVSCETELVVEVDAASALVIADGAVVGYDATNKVAVAAATGDFDIGKAQEGGKANGETSVRVALNVGI